MAFHHAAGVSLVALGCVSLSCFLEATVAEWQRSHHAPHTMIKGIVTNSGHEGISFVLWFVFFCFRVDCRLQDFDLQQKLKPMMKSTKPLPSIYFPDFIAANQAERADNVLTGTKQEQMDQVTCSTPDSR